MAIAHATPKFERTFTDIVEDELYYTRNGMGGDLGDDDDDGLIGGIDKDWFKMYLESSGNSKHQVDERAISAVADDVRRLSAANNPHETVSPKDAFLDFDEVEGKGRVSDGGIFDDEDDGGEEELEEEEEEESSTPSLDSSGTSTSTENDGGGNGNRVDEMNNIKSESSSSPTDETSDTEYVAPRRPTRLSTPRPSTPTTPRPCAECDRKFDSQQALLVHRRTRHGDVFSDNIKARGPHRCHRINPQTGKPCNTVFSRSYDLIRHEGTIHAPEKIMFTCDMCGSKQFSRHDALVRHKRVKHSVR